MVLQLLLLWVRFFGFVELNYFSLTLLADIRELISLDDVMEELGLGPNGGLIYCMEYPFLLFLNFSVLSSLQPCLK